MNEATDIEQLCERLRIETAAGALADAKARKLESELPRKVGVE
jgi:hypothetical protein